MHAATFIDEIDDTIRILQNEIKLGCMHNGIIKGALVELNVPNNLVVVGDIHGDITSLRTIMQNINFQEFLSNSNNKLIFLGDYIDRGSNSVEVLRIVFYLKREYPDSVILLCGNHEAIDKYYCATHTLPSELSYRFEKISNTIYDKLFFLFRLLPRVTIIRNNLLLIHGGIPTCIDVRDFYSSVSETKLDAKIEEELLWNDPRSDMPENLDWVDSRRGFGRHFGKNISKKFLDHIKVKALIRSHEPCHGFRVDHDNMILTLFSTKESYQKFDAAYIHIIEEELVAIKNALDLIKYVKKI